MKTFMDITEMFSFLLMIKNVCKKAYATFFPHSFFFFFKQTTGGISHAQSLKCFCFVLWSLLNYLITFKQYLLTNL